MDRTLQDTADAALERAIRDRGARDPRDACRALLRHVRARDREAYERAVAYYEETLVPTTASGEAEPLEAWLDYARLVARTAAPGRTVEIDGAGVARDCVPPIPPDRLVLHLPDGGDPPALLVAQPATMTPAQEATCDLLLGGRVTLREAGERASG
ncbi:MAG: hypothetical protein HY704_04745 [Gemmatimonadetes bacterium]|nr:hypothetical protein [Gemmatimonadota bacterium]